MAPGSWKTKYYVLHEDKLYYYASMKGQAGGVIDLQHFSDCVEAPLSDQKKANNVFFLIAEERGFFDQVTVGFSYDVILLSNHIFRGATTSQQRHSVR